MNDDRLRQAAYRYLERFAATEATLLRVLERKIRRALGPDADSAEVEHWRQMAARTAAACVEMGLVDDRAFAAARARRLHGQGKPLGRIGGALAEKGVAQEHIEKAIEELAQESGEARGLLDLRAGIAYARRRRLGPFARENAGDSPQRQKAFASFARAGFSYGIAAAVLGAADLEDLERLLEEEAERLRP